MFSTHPRPNSQASFTNASADKKMRSDQSTYRITTLPSGLRVGASADSRDTRLERKLLVVELEDGHR